MNEKTYYIETYGCQMNEYDSALVESLLETEGYTKASVPEGADVVLVNTCSVREKAEETAYEKLRNFQALKKSKPGMKLGMIGCMAENKKESVFTRLPKLDLAVGPDHYEELGHLLGLSGRNTSLGTSRASVYEGAYAQAISGAAAHVAVQRGCNFHCAYCIVPSTRGPEKSRSLADVLEEVRRLAKKGVVEISLLGQTVNAYRAADGTWIELLHAVSQVEGIERIRYTSPHPRYFTRPVVEAMAQLPKVMPHVHLPVQSGSTPILKAMKRQYTRDHYLATVERLRELIPGVSITTDIIAGFPGETLEDHEATLSLMEAVRFEQAFMFAYSPRPGTPSALVEESIDATEKQRRLAEIIELQHEHTRQRLDESVGLTESVMLEGPSRREATEWIGKTPQWRKVIVDPGEGAVAGQILSVKITARRGTVLWGERA
ncbi:MAG: hypothetical protein RL318_3078 [Fibrobacterota bacterium]